MSWLYIFNWAFSQVIVSTRTLIILTQRSICKNIEETIVMFQKILYATNTLMNLEQAT